MTWFLIVDDSVFSQKITARYLKKYFGNVPIGFAADGQEGLEKYEELKPDCVFVDLLMPKISGKDLIPILKRKGCKNIVVLSADVQRGIREEIEALGVTAFVNKPLNDETMRELSGKIEEAQDGKI